MMDIEQLVPNVDVGIHGSEAEWRNYPLSHLISDLSAGVSVNGEDRTAGPGERGVLRVSAVTSGRFNPNEHKTVILEDVPNVAEPVRAGSILISRANTLELVGASAFVESDYPNLFLPDKLWRVVLRDPEHTSLRWLSFVLQLDAVRREISNVATGSGAGMKNISKPALLKIEVPVPPLLEQRRIAEILGAWDRALERLAGLIEAKERRKRGVMRRLLPPTFRTPNVDWKRCAMSDVAHMEIRPVTKPATNFLSLGIRSHGKGTFLKYNFDPNKIELDTLFEVRAGDLIVNITFAWEGAIAIAQPQDDHALVSHRFPTYVIDTSIAAPEFIRYLIVQPEFQRTLGLISPGGAGRNRVMSKRDFDRIEINLPSLNQQRKIGTFLSLCDLEIDTLKDELEAVRRQKKGLMQQLLTGKVRVKVAEPMVAEL